ncbi:sphingolipid delta(4)-desaturase/C4-hydroxylase DES2 [Platysternon megacephalum]|uniref:Sphingolipid delta(4)-desaturase/C4-hydroxylase DES2 n=1 Tax=Platysternon megacephalum TaxID=55544 RepID=A0A4D9F2S5_9SAUR|nr:sphingolipid delta(4)-desaturase/C4-hydroxylase DES2 [Platysternon megacephalum]
MHKLVGQNPSPHTPTQSVSWSRVRGFEQTKRTEYPSREPSLKENSSFSCYTEPLDDASPKPKVIKLYLGSKNLVSSQGCWITFAFLSELDTNTEELHLNKVESSVTPSFLILFYSSGMKQGEMVVAAERSGQKTLNAVHLYSLYVQPDIAPIEEWFVRFTMHHRLNMFTTEGTLLDVFREPLLQWQPGKPMYSTEIDALIPDVINITVSKCPCANDVAVIALICNDTVHGIYLGVTNSGFISRDTEWFNMTDSLCSLLDDDCAGLSLVNIILTNNHLIILTTLGLFISQDLRYPTGRILNFTKPSFCGFERDDYFSANVWYNVQCLANAESYEVDYISLSFNKDKTLSQVSTCFYSNDPYTEWYSCLPHRFHGGKTLSKRVVAFLIDYQQNTGIGLITVQNKAMVSVCKIIYHKLNRQTKFPVFWFPDPKFLPFGMFFHPGSHFLYVYGSQVWFSDDGGNTFMLLITLENEIIIKTNMCVYSHSIAFVTDKGNIFFTKAGSERYAKLTTSAHNVFNLYYDHLGSLNIISLNESVSDRLEIHLLDVITLIQEGDIGFDGPLSPQYITEQQMVFFEHIPLNGKSRSIQKSRFYGLHKGKVLQYRPSGSATIVDVFHHEYPPQYLSSVIVDVLERFPFESEDRSSFTDNSLSILKVSNTTRVKLQILSECLNVFKPSDIEKTVLIPGFSSFLIVEVLDSLNALADATMPERVPFNTTFASGMWFVYDFGTKNGRKWKIIVDTCRYWVRELDNLPLNAIKYLDLTQTFNFGFRVTPVNTAYPIFHMPLMKLAVGNPSLFKVKTNDYWDDTDSYMMEFSVTNNFYKQGKSSIAVILTKASLVCGVSTIVLTLKSGCSYSKSMHYISPVSISAQSWLHGDPKDPYGFKFLKQLPVNYRPPSKLGIAVPLTDNFYNADPGKPRMRDYFAGSKNSGAYKQCANKSTRAECNCDDNAKLSFFVAFSDCKEKALRMKYPVTRLPVYFRVDTENEYIPLVSPFFVTVTEVNHRTNWEVAGTNETPSMLKMRAYLADKLNITLYNPEALALNIYGSELFHFRVATIPGVSFCNLLDEFQIYVDDAPLAFPGQYLVSTVTAVLVGGIIFVIFMMQMYEINIWNKVKSKVRKKNKVSVSETSATVTSTSS